MKKTNIAFVAALLCTGLALPALADWDNIGSIDVGGDMRDRGMDRRGPGMNGPGMNGPGMRMERDVKTFDLGGPVERLQLRAERSDVNCRSVDASFANGQRRSIFSGMLREGRSTDVDLPGRDRTIRALDFNCTADRGPMATIRIVADVGRYRPDWQRNPDFQRTWSKVFNWGSDQFNNWQMIGSESFRGNNDREQVFAGWNGRHVDSIALKPIGADARCLDVTAHFDRRQQQRLDANHGAVMRQGQYYKIDLPGNYRNLDSINLRCNALNARRVEIQIFTSH